MKTFKQFSEGKVSKDQHDVYTVHSADPGDGDPESSEHFIQGVHKTKEEAIAHAKKLITPVKGQMSASHVQVIGHKFGEPKYKYGGAGTVVHDEFYQDDED